MNRVLVSLPGNEALCASLARAVHGEIAPGEHRRFPDGDSYVRLDASVEGADVALVCTLDRPDEKVVPLLLAAETARDLGAARVGLVAPYLSYLRQDRRFRPGEGVTSRYFARLLSGCVDWLLTVDPHLHRYRSLAEIYTIPARAVHSAPLLAAWVRAHVEAPLIIGPDRESERWATAVAAAAGAPCEVLEKVRHGERDVEVSVPNATRWRDRTPVLVDDVISTGRTLAESLRHLGSAGRKPPVCLGVHAVFVDGALEALRAAGASRIVTCNTIPHETNAIDVTELLASAWIDGPKAGAAKEPAPRDAGPRRTE
jgi:ribose-phosphate pyrophosphokinase